MDHRRFGDLYEYGILTAEASPVGGAVRELRERLSALELTGGQSAELEELDAVLLEAVADGDVLDEIVIDDSAYPLSHWWWHLGALRTGTFPAEQLPPHLRPLYPAAA